MDAEFFKSAAVWLFWAVIGCINLIVGLQITRISRIEEGINKLKDDKVDKSDLRQLISGLDLGRAAAEAHRTKLDATATATAVAVGELRGQVAGILTLFETWIAKAK